MSDEKRSNHNESSAGKDENKFCNVGSWKSESLLGFIVLKKVFGHLVSHVTIAV